MLPLKTIVAGSRGIADYTTVKRAMRTAPWMIQHVVSGRANGVDLLGEQVAAEYKIPVSRFPANWDKHGKRAGHIRNVQMAEFADALVAVWDGKSPGTRDMIAVMTKLDKPVHVVRVTDLNA